MKETVIDLIRHGEPEGGSLYRGHTVDDPLSEKGWQQMWSAVEGHAPWQQIITSPMQRCHAFAEALAEKLDVPVQVEKRFVEVGFGSWEGCTREQLKQERPEEYEAFYRDPVNARPSGAENLDAFIDRVVKAYEACVQAHAGRHCLLVSHAGVMRAILAHTLRAEPLGLYRMRIANAGISRIRYKALGVELEFMNGHL